MASAIDHPPGSPVFNALKERIEAMGWTVTVNRSASNGASTDLKYAAELNGRADLIQIEMTMGDIYRHGVVCPVDEAFHELARLAKLAGVELED